MPIHDWTKVLPGDFHDFHQGWTTELRTRLNRGILPDGYFAQIEQVTGHIIPDVLTLQRGGTETPEDLGVPTGGLLVDVVPPRVSISVELELRSYDALKNVVAIHHASSHRLVAMIELVSFGNKSSQRDFSRFVDKSLDAIEMGIHLLIVDLYPPTSRDPHGIHGAIWSELGDDTYCTPPGKNLTAVAYVAAQAPRAFVEPLAVGSRLIPMPLFLSEEVYVEVPLGEAYDAAFLGTASHLQRELEKTIPR